MAKLKVFRVPIGFHDAFVAAPSQKAALKAWGSDADLFARGIAEQVMDPRLTAAPLEHPGTVIKVARGTREDYFTAAGDQAKKVSNTKTSSGEMAREQDNKRERVNSTAARDTLEKPASAPRQRKPRPSRAAMERAEMALADAEHEMQAELARLLAKKQAIDKKRQAVRAAFDRRRTSLDRQIEREHRAYRAKLNDWAGS